MEAKLIVISQLGRELITTRPIKLHYLSIKHLQNQIYDLYPAMYFNEDYKLYWRYDSTTIFSINDSFSLYAAIHLMSEYVLYMVIRDVAPWNTKFRSEPNGELEAIRYCIKYLLPPQKHYTTDHCQLNFMISSLQKGFPGELKQLEPPSSGSVPVKPLVSVPKKGKDVKSPDGKNKKGKK